jgi:hypothetical protein
MTIADVVLIEYPTTGKSTLARYSEQNLKVGSYPFTTVRPHIGVDIEPSSPHYDARRITVADIPALIEAATAAAWSRIPSPYRTHVRSRPRSGHLVIHNIKSYDSNLCCKSEICKAVI